MTLFCLGGMMRKGGSQQSPLARMPQNPKAGSDPARLDQYLLKVEQLTAQGGLAPHTAQWEVRKAGVGSDFCSHLTLLFFPCFGYINLVSFIYLLK